MNAVKTLIRGVAAAAALLGTLAGAAAAENYPNRPVTLIVPFNAGGGIDVIARKMAAALQEITGQPFIVENRPGASGTIGLRHVIEAAPDGHTLLASNNTMVTNAAMERGSLGIGTEIKGVAAFNTAPLAIAVHPDIPANSVAELIEYLREASSPPAYSSCGTGTVLHLAAELFKQVAEVKMEHVSYGGCGPAITDGLGGHVPILFNTIPNVLPHAQAGTLRLLAVTRPIDIGELGNEVAVLYEIPGFEKVRAEVWSGLFAPAGTPDELVQTINGLIEQAKSKPVVTEHFKKSYQLPLDYSPQGFSDMVVEDLARWQTVVTNANLTTDK